MFVEMFEMEIVQKRGLVADGCRQHDSVTTDAMSFYRNNHNAAIMLFPRLTHRYATTTNTSSRCRLTHALQHDSIRVELPDNMASVMPCVSIETIVMLSSNDSSSCDVDWHLHIVMLSQMRSSLIFLTRTPSGPLTRLVRTPMQHGVLDAICFGNNHQISTDASSCYHSENIIEMVY